LHCNALCATHKLLQPIRINDTPHLIESAMAYQLTAAHGNDRII